MSQNLTDEQSAGFLAIIERYGAAVEVIDGADHTDQPTVVSGDHFQSNVQPGTVTFTSISDMKTKMGISSAEASGENIAYPPPVSSEELKLFKTAKSTEQFLSGLTAEQRENLSLAMECYVLGVSDQVSSYVPIINKVYFPMTAVMHSSKNLTITDKAPLIIKGPGPVIASYGKIEATGGYIEITTNCQFSCQALNIKAGFTLPIKVSGTPYTEPATAGTPGATGTAGVKGQNGMATYNAKTCQYTCEKAPTNGTDGGKGTDGHDGMNGLDGKTCPGVFFDMGTISGDIKLGAGGADGQDGGAGGTGGNGGPGGAAGTTAYSKHATSDTMPQPGRCPEASAGMPGPAGDGGNGGNAGDGGEGGIVLFEYTSSSGMITPSYDTGLPGQAGAGGNGGAGNPGGSGGNAGGTGQAGSDAIITIRKKS